MPVISRRTIISTNSAQIENGQLLLDTRREEIWELQGKPCWVVAIGKRPQ
jgi:hypothetical protein